MPFILNLTRAHEPRPAESAVQARVLAEDALGIVRRYGPRAVLQATADALTYYLAQAENGEPATTTEAYEATADAIQAARRAVAAIDRETIRQFSRT